ncbi:MAG: helix-turn-helix domain-containing protein [Desulfovibrionaceae bacterium]|jgi:transcriptional regulator with XRE-family HTH domain
MEPESIPWREAFPETDQTLPGVCLHGARTREGLTQKQLSGKTDIPTRPLSEMENGKRSIGKAMAKRLGEALGVGYKVFL